MAQIDWNSFSWEAFATLAAGFGAVIAATVIGVRQTGIADRQARILERQVALDELRLRSDLFDRRWAVYEATREFLAEIMRHAAEPKQELQHEFLMSMNEASFLFHPKVSEELQDMWKRSCEFFAVKSISTHLYQTTGQYGKENIEKSHNYLLWLSDKRGKIGDVFGEEMNLSAIEASRVSD